MNWSEDLIAAALSTQFLNRQHLVIVPNAKWTGHECDLICVTKGLNIIDFEIKISRSDFYADAKKQKWWDEAYPSRTRTPREHPIKVWKHYYVMPAEIFTPEMLEKLPSQSCGVLLLEFDSKNRLQVRCKRKAKPNKHSTAISHSQVIDIARLATLRLWSMIESRGAA